MSPRSPVQFAEHLLEELGSASAHVPGLYGYLEDRVRFWGSRSWRVGLLGITSSGKSTLVNGFFGEPLLPARVRPSSNVLILSQRGEGPRARVHFADGRPPELVNRRLAQRLSTLSDETKNPRNRLSVKEIEVWHPRFALQSTATLVDTPGLDAFGHEDHERLTLQTFLPTVDLVVFLTTAKTNADAQIERYLREIRDAHKPVILVQNMIDTIEPKLGVGGRVLRSRTEVAEELRRRAQRVAKQATGEKNVPVHQVAARRAVEGDSVRSGLPELAAAVERELARLTPQLEAGRYHQLLRELERQTPPATRAEGRAAAKRERRLLDRANGELTALKAETAALRNLSPKPLCSERAAMLSKRTKVGTSKQARSLWAQATKWRAEHVSVLHDWTAGFQQRAQAVARMLDLMEDDYIVPSGTSSKWTGGRVPTRTKRWTETVDKKGLWNKGLRWLGIGGVEERQHSKTVLNESAFQEEFRSAIVGVDRWQERERNRIADIGEEYVRSIEGEMTRREAVLEQRQQLVDRELEQAALRTRMLAWIEELSGVAGAAQKTRRGRAGSACAPLDEVEVVSASAAALRGVELADLVARVRFVAARDAVLMRSPRAKQLAVVGWDKLSIEAFIDRFFPEAVRTTRGEGPVHTWRVGNLQLTTVDEGRCDHDYHALASTGPVRLFLLLDLVQAGATESTLEREAHLFQSPFEAVCLVPQAPRVFAGAHGWDAEALAEAMVEAERMLGRRGIRLDAVLANDDDIGLTVLLDHLVREGRPCTVREEQTLLATMAPLVEADQGAKLLRAWPQVEIDAALSRESEERRSAHSSKPRSKKVSKSRSRKRRSRHG